MDRCKVFVHLVNGVPLCTGKQRFSGQSRILSSSLQQKRRAGVDTRTFDSNVHLVRAHCRRCSESLLYINAAFKCRRHQAQMLLCFPSYRFTPNWSPQTCKLVPRRPPQDLLLSEEPAWLESLSGPCGGPKTRLQRGRLPRAFPAFPPCPSTLHSCQWAFTNTTSSHKCICMNLHCISRCGESAL